MKTITKTCKQCTDRMLCVVMDEERRFYHCHIKQMSEEILGLKREADKKRRQDGNIQRLKRREN